MVELSQRKEDVVSSLADAEQAIQRVRDHLMSVAFRTIDASAKEDLLAKAQEAVSLLEPGVKELKGIIEAIES